MSPRSPILLLATTILSHKIFSVQIEKVILKYISLREFYFYTVRRLI